MIVVMVATFNQTMEERSFMRSLVDNKIDSIAIKDEIISNSSNKVYLDCLAVSKEYREIDFEEIFPNCRRISRGRKSDHFMLIEEGLRGYYLIKDDLLGTIRIEDHGENYLIPRDRFDDKSYEEDFIDYLSSNGINCKEANEYFLTIPKEKIAE
jgi:hypothetical protein